MVQEERSAFEYVISLVTGFWGGLFGLIAGVALLVCSAHAFLVLQILWPWGFGVGFGLTLIGGFALFYAYEERRYGRGLDRNRGAGCETVIVEFPFVRDLAQAQRDWIEPLCDFVEDDRLGKVASVDSGKPGTPQEFGFRVTIEAYDPDATVREVRRVLELLGAPDTTTIEVCEAVADP